MMENYERTIELVEVAQNSLGQSEEQFAKYQDTVEYKINQIKNAWEQLRISFLNSDAIKSALDLFRSFIDTVGDMNRSQFAAIGLIGLTLGKQMIMGMIKGFQSGAGALTAAANTVFAKVANGVAKAGSGLSSLVYDKKNAAQIATMQAQMGQMGVLQTNINTQTAKWVLLLGQYDLKLDEIITEETALQNKQNQLMTSQQNLSDEELERLRYLQEQKKVLQDQANIVQNKLSGAGVQYNTLNKTAIKDTAKTASGGPKVLSQNAQIATQALNSGIQSAITTALIVGISGADLSTAIKTAGVAALTTVIPQILSAVLPTIIAFLTGPVGIIAGIGAALIAGVVIYEKKQEELRNAELERLSNIEEANKKLQQQTDDLMASYKKRNAEEEKYQKAIDVIKETQNKSFLTTDEQTELDDTVTYLQGQYEGLIEQIENSERFKVVEEKLTQIEENTRGDKQKDVSTAYLNLSGQYNNLQDREEEAKRLLMMMNHDGAFIGPKDQAGYDSGLVADINAPYNTGIEYAYATTKTALEQIRPYLEDLKTIYGEALDLDKIFGVSGFDRKILGDTSTNELAEIFENNGKSTIDILKVIEEDVEAGTYQGGLSQAIAEIDSTAREQTSQTGIKDNLLMQGWDEAAAEIASYTKNIELREVEALSTEQSSGNFLGDIKNSNFKQAFGEDFAESAEKAFEALGYGGEEGKAFSELFSSGTNVVKFSELSEELQSAIYNSSSQMVQETAKTWDKDGLGRADRKQAEKMKEVLLQVLAEQMISASEFFQEEDQELLENNQPKFAELSSKMLDFSGQTWEEYSKEVDAIINSTGEGSDVYNAMTSYKNEAEESIYRQWQGYIDGLKEIKVDERILAKMDFGATKTLSEELSSLNLSSFGMEQITDYINANFSKLNKETLNLLGQIDLSDLADLSLTSSEEYVKQLTEATGSAELATKLYTEYIQKVQSITRTGAFLGENSTVALTASFQDYFKGFTDKYGILETASKEMFENQAISAETYYKAIEEGFEDYVDRTSNGYVLLGKRAEEMWSKMALNPLTELQNKIKQQEILIAEANDIQNSFKTGINREVNLTEGIGGGAPSIIRNYSYSEEEINALIEKYSLLSDEEKESTNLLAAFTEKEKEFINFITTEGYTSIQDYSQALEEGRIELNKMTPDVWIESLVAMSEMISSTEEEIEKLRETYEKLTETQKENLLALEDAEKKLNEAKNGTANYRSTLDSLINYTNKLARLNDSLSTTKERLEDVSNISEAQGLLEQLGITSGNKKATLGAENLAINEGLQNLRNSLLNNYGDYISFDASGLANLDFGYEELLRENDNLKKNLEDEFSKYTELYEKRESNLKEIAEVDKELEELHEKYLEDYITVQDNLISILKESAQEEIDIQKDKYSALEEADNNYLGALEEAIDKQRKLREKENQYEDLAQKEKKLSLMQRDTSGANQKEVATLQKDVEGSRQDLLDSEVDNIVDSLKEMYEAQKEARDTEIEYMETVTDSAQYFADWASEIMSSWHSVEDMQNWYLQNDTSTQDMTIEQTENYLNGIKEDYSKLAAYRAEQTTDYITKAEEINTLTNQIFENTTTNLADVGDSMMTTAQIAADEAIESATEAANKAKQKIEETQEELDETFAAIIAAEDNAVVEHKATMETMIEATRSGFEEVAALAIKTMAEMEGIDWTDKDSVVKWGTEKNFITTNNGISTATEGFNRAYSDKNNGETLFNNTYKVSWGASNLFNSKTFSTEGLAEEYKKKLDEANAKVPGWRSEISAYATGGLVDYTGPAWVDGTKTHPESFLSAEDTERIGNAAKLLSNIPALRNSGYNNQVSTNVGDTHVEIHLNIDGIASDYDVDRMMDRVKQSITETANSVGSPVILSK